MPKQRDMTAYNCLDCKQTFYTQFRRIKLEGNRCSSCAAKYNNSKRIYLPISEETRNKMSEVKKGKPCWAKGRKFTYQHRLNMSKVRKGKPGHNKGKHFIPIEIRKRNEKIHDCCSGMVRRILKIKNESKVRKTFEYLKYNKTDFMNHIESLWLDGMSWENYGEWQIDHIIPVSYFIKNNITDISIINALNNLQPLWKKDNLSKGNKILSSNTTKIVYDVTRNIA